MNEALKSDSTQEWDTPMQFWGLMSYVVTPEVIKKAREIAEERERKKDDNRKPPKPPSRPNISIGKVALSGSN